jgi:hypothetical protein
MRVIPLVTGLVMLGMIFTGIITFVGDVTDNYGVTVSPEFQTTYEAFNRTTALMANQSDNFRATVEESSSGGSSGGSGALGFVDSFFSIGWGAVKALTGSIQIAGQMIATIGIIPGMSPYIIPLVTIVALGIILTLLSIMLKRRL